MTIELGKVELGLGKMLNHLAEIWSFLGIQAHMSEFVSSFGSRASSVYKVRVSGFGQAENLILVAKTKHN